jgi:hypothetical protein
MKELGAKVSFASEVWWGLACRFEIGSGRISLSQYSRLDEIPHGAVQCYSYEIREYE